MKSLQSLLQKKEERPKKSVSLDEKTLFFLFERVMKREYGNQGARAFTPRRYKNNTLYLTLNGGSVWANELWLHREEIIGFINEECGKREVKEVKIR